MTRAEERAMEVYPPRMAYNSMVGVALKEKRDINANNRQIFIQGYVTAEQDLTDKAKFSSGWDGFYYGQGYKQAQQDTIDRACQILYDLNKQMTEMFGAKAVLSCNQFTIDVDRFRKILELEGL